MHTMHPFLHTVCTLLAHSVCTLHTCSTEGLLANNYHKMKYTCPHPLLPHPIVHLQELRLCCLSPEGQGDQMDQSVPVAGEREEGDVLAQSGFIQGFSVGMGKTCDIQICGLPRPLGRPGLCFSIKSLW